MKQSNEGEEKKGECPTCGGNLLYSENYDAWVCFKCGTLYDLEDYDGKYYVVITKLISITRSEWDDM